ncbi:MULTISPECIES: DoxX family protein [Flavobacterium]|uniref:DoxX family protein n=1 Tax=Flavobacterium TaxID=237 RepID=UPI001182535B|nr:MULTISPECIES: DoxX family protein [Flavobacterium]MCR4032097.1 DoxX family protein [Flavobacterium panacis]
MKDLISTNSKKTKKIYWTVTVVSMIMIIVPPYFLPNNQLEETIHRLGYPNYFRSELDILKIVGAIVILIPSFPTMFKEWAYVGFGILLLSASLAHFVTDGIAEGFPPLIPFIVLSVSYYYFRKLFYNNN